MRFPTAVESLPPLARDEADDVVRLDDVSVRYRLNVGRAGLKEALVDSLVRRRRSTVREHVALDSVDLHVSRGEAVGVIGANGAGKSTLLRVIGRILHPTSGRLRIRGRVAPLLDLTGGFHPELTGRENAFLQMALLGIGRRDVTERFATIAAFADIGDFIDAPLRTYSAGMMMRLGFSVVTSVDADILLVDEALGVGDAAFQEKCTARIAGLRGGGRSFLIVSHDLMRLRELCDRLVWLDHGRVRANGNPADVISQYAASVVR
jgi:ABC-type polysaccharide/polyol phosphate transport system ATPase subunit